MRRMVAIVVLAGLVAAAGAAGWLVEQWHGRYRGYTGKAAVVDVQRGSTTRDIAWQFQRAGVVRSALAFEVWSRLHMKQKLEAGEYRFDRPMTPPQVFQMVAGGQIWTVALTVPEGWTMFDIADAVQREGLASRASFLRAARNPALIRDFAPHAPTLEGFLFPATYEFPHRITAKAITLEMVRRFRQAWTNLTRNDPPPSNFTPEQIVTLASLVQEETAKPEERPIIAGVFLNRLRLAYPLECDPSVIYALKLAGLYDGQLHASELNIQSPYNTYLHYGLPPGPIGNPGMASLQAVLHPAQTDYLYFVANGSGGHSFSRTLAGQTRNVARYRRFIAKEKNEATPIQGQHQPAVLHGRHSGSETHR
jgi:UPF0755 protein